MPRIFVFLASFVIFLPQSNADQLEESRIELEAKKKVQISKSLELSSEQGDDFWAVYADYERELGQSTKDSFNLIRKFSAGYENGTITEQSAVNMMAEFFRIEARKLQTKQSYLSRFQQVMPAKKVFRFYQIDNKIDSLIRCDIARKLPLIEPDMEF